jgi:hypothetical protein
MNSVSVSAGVAGVTAGVFAAICAPWAFAASLCREGGGSIVNFGLSCQVPACESFSLASYIPIELAAMAIVFIGIPIGFTVYSVVLRTTRPLPPK